MLFGAVNPSGRLPVTFPNKENELDFSGPEYPGTDGNCTGRGSPPCAPPGQANYSHQLLIGYRYYDANKIQPKFAFGHGLSYGRFNYSSLTATRDQVTVTISNTGNVDGHEVVQLYLGFPAASNSPPQQLKGFKKVLVKAGASAEVMIPITSRDRSVWSVEKHDWEEVQGTVAVRVGASSRDIRLKGTFDNQDHSLGRARIKIDETTLSPQVFWASQPTFGGQTVQVFGSGLGGTSSVTVVSLATTTNLVSTSAFDVSPTSFKVTLPASLPDGAYRLCTTTATSACVTLNAPDVWWLRGDANLTHATPGGWVRLFGRLGDEGQRLVSPVLTLGAHELMRHNGSANDALFMLPTTLQPGEYPVKLRVAGLTIPVADAALVVAPKSRWPGSDNVISVNTTYQLWAALNETRRGGGTILMQRGTYAFTTESIDLPDHTTLRGVSTAAVHLVWHTAEVNRSQVPKYFVGGNATFAIEDLTISCDRFYNNIITDGSNYLADPVRREHSRGVRIRRIRIRADCYTRLTEAGAGEGRRGLPGADFTYEQVGSGINLDGQEYEVIDCDIYASGHGISLGVSEGSLASSASVGLVQRNTINFGAECYQIDSSSHVVFEDNECVGTNLFSRGSPAGSTYAGPAATDIVFQRNSIRFLFGGDGEELTLDGGTSPLNGRGVTVDGNNVVRQ